MFAKSPDGKTIPLEKVQAYSITEATEDTALDLALGRAGAPDAHRVEFDTYISHFLTCKHANQFSKGRKR